MPVQCDGHVKPQLEQALRRLSAEQREAIAFSFGSRVFHSRERLDAPGRRRVRSRSAPIARIACSAGFYRVRVSPYVPPQHHELVARLTADLEPVKRPWPPGARSVAWLALAAVVVACAGAVGLRTDVRAAIVLVALRLGSVAYCYSACSATATKPELNIPFAPLTRYCSPVVSCNVDVGCKFHDRLNEHSIASGA